MLIMALLVLGIGFVQDVVDLLADVLDVFNEFGFFISLIHYMCGLCLCGHIRYVNIRQ